MVPSDDDMGRIGQSDESGYSLLYDARNERLVEDISSVDD
jgi:hypothetical protein